MAPVYLETRAYTVDLVRSEPDTLFVFGDNTLRTGKGGQAIIRDEPNTLGIATKHYPSMEPSSFFSDDIKSYNALMVDISSFLSYVLYSELDSSRVALPYHGLGTGLARLPSRAPKLYQILLKLVYKDNGVPYKHLLEPNDQKYYLL